MIESFFASGHVADLVLAVMAIEVIAMFILMRRGSIILPFRTYLAGVIAGGFIVFALRLALTGEAWTFIALALGLSFAAHITELLSFLRRNNGNPNYTAPSYQSRSDSGTTSKKGL